MQNNQTFAFARGYFWGIRPIIRKPHIICAVILVNPCFIHVHDIIPCFPKRFYLSQIITPIIDNRHLVVQNSSNITYYPRSMRVWVSLDFDILIESFISLCIIETVGAISREYKPWIVLLITQWSKSSKMLALSLGLFDLQGLLPFIVRCTEV